MPIARVNLCKIYDFGLIKEKLKFARFLQALWRTLLHFAHLPRRAYRADTKQDACDSRQLQRVLLFREPIRARVQARLQNAPLLWGFDGPQGCQIAVIAHRGFAVKQTMAE